MKRQWYNQTCKKTNWFKKMKALHGLTRTLVANMVEGVTKGYEKKIRN